MTEKCENRQMPLCSVVVRLNESVSFIREDLAQIKKDLEHLRLENQSRHEESRESYYLAETTRKALEETYDVQEKKLEVLEDSLKGHETKFNQLREDRSSLIITILKYVIFSLAAVVTGLIGSNLGDVFKFLLKVFF